MIERTLTDVSPSEADGIIGDFESEGCTAKKTPQGDGNFTVVATCPVALH